MEGVGIGIDALTGERRFIVKEDNMIEGREFIEEIFEDSLSRTCPEQVVGVKCSVPYTCKCHCVKCTYSKR